MFGYQIQNTENQYAQAIQQGPIKYSFICDMKGIGLSMIDERPAEIFYLIIQGIKAEGYWELEEALNNDFQQNMGLNLTVQHLQMDNQYGKKIIFPVIVVPRLLQDQVFVPCLQFQIHRERLIHGLNLDNDLTKGLGVVDKYSMLAFAISELDIKLEQIITFRFLDYLMKIIDCFIFSRDMQVNENSTLKEICPLLDPSSPQLTFEPGAISQKAYFEFVHLHALKLNISLRTTKKKIIVNPKYSITGLIYNIGGKLTNITDSSLRFKELAFSQSFQTVNTLTWLIIKNYARQGILQFYRILGSSDLIGNPIGLVDKVGRGVLEFVGEPAKGLLKGPKEFVGGVGKGMKGLATNVVGGGMESVSKITGSLYGVVRSVGGDAEGQDRLSKPDTALQGLGQGIQGGFSDLGEGLSGIFTKPYQGAKQEGGKGFFKGVGKGLVGAITSPFSAILRVGNTVSAGLSAQASGALKAATAGRYRLPRYFGPRLVLEEYDQMLSQAQACLQNVNQGKYANSMQGFIQNDFNFRSKAIGLDRLGYSNFHRARDVFYQKLRHNLKKHFLF